MTVLVVVAVVVAVVVVDVRGCGRDGGAAAVGAWWWSTISPASRARASRSIHGRGTGGAIALPLRGCLVVPYRCTLGEAHSSQQSKFWYSVRDGSNAAKDYCLEVGAGRPVLSGFSVKPSYSSVQVWVCIRPSVSLGKARHCANSTQTRRSRKKESLAPRRVASTRRRMQLWTRAALIAVAMATNPELPFRGRRHEVRGDLQASAPPTTGGLSMEERRSTRRGERPLRVSTNEVVSALLADETCVYHAPPPPFANDDEYYHPNDTPFGSILRGEAPAKVYTETATLLAFADRSPQADLHALIIPKREIGSVFDLRPSDLPLLYELENVAHELLVAYEGNGRLVFHVPPFNSVQHLHLHVLSDRGLTWAGRTEYWYETRWCTSWESVVRRLERGENAVPYKRALL